MDVQAAQKHSKKLPVDEALAEFAPFDGQSVEIVEKEAAGCLYCGSFDEPVTFTVAIRIIGIEVQVPRWTLEPPIAKETEWQST